MNTLQNLLEECTQKGIIKIVVSNPRKGEKKTRIEIRPFEQKGVILYQTASYNNNQVYHKNRTREELIWFVKECTTEYKQINIFCPTEQISVLISKKGKVTIKRQKNTAVKELSLQHNRKKQYILPEDKRKELYKKQKNSGTIHNENRKVGRNDPCPCGSGKKYKQCCGR